jgi:hypothetical protein
MRHNSMFGFTSKLRHVWIAAANTTPHHTPRAAVVAADGRHTLGRVWRSTSVSKQALSLSSSHSLLSRLALCTNTRGCHFIPLLILYASDLWGLSRKHSIYGSSKHCMNYSRVVKVALFTNNVHKLFA